MTPPLKLGLSMRFNVVVDGISLGNWSSCKGLDFSCKVHKIREGGSYDFEHILFVDVEYSTIKLERAMDATSSRALQTWLSTELRSQPGMNPTAPGKTATITLYGPAGVVVATWNLRGVYPKGWTGPDMNASKSAVALERLELVHEGFL